MWFLEGDMAKLSLSFKFMTAAALGLTLCAGVHADNPTHPLKVGYLPVTGHAKFFVAKEQGLFAQEGLDVELIEFVNSALALLWRWSGKEATALFWLK